MEYHQVESETTGRTFEVRDDGIPSRRQLLEWLRDAEDDLGELADIVNSIAARQGMVSQAQRANDIAHKWIHRRSLRLSRQSD
jgi:hypothetical protein